MEKNRPMTPNHSFTRRAFLSCTCGCAGAALAWPAVSALGAAAAENPGKQWQIGCYTRPFDQFDYRTAFDGIAEAGFKYVGLMTTNTKDWVIIKPSTPPEEVQKMNEEADKRGLKVLSIYGDFKPAETGELPVADRTILIGHCKTCSCPHLLLGGTTDPKLYSRYYDTIRECCSYAAENAVTLTIKPHGGQNATGPECRKAIDLVNRPNFRLWYDPGNIFYYSDGKLDPVEDAPTVDGLVAGISVKDFRPPKDVLVNPGAGKVDFARVFARLRKGGFDHGPVILECLERGKLGQVKAAAKNARLFLERLLGV